MSTLVASLTALPYTQFRKSRHFYLWYDGFWLTVVAGLVALMHLAGWQGFTQTWDWRVALFLPLACHIQILCSVWIHNCTHNNFPRAINRIVGELCGIVVLTRFASWEILHQRHHKYSDDVELDPHPIAPGWRGYWKFTFRNLVAIEQQLQQIYFEQFGGKTPQNVRYQRYRAILSFGTMVALIYAWHLFLGKVLFWMLFFPAGIVGVLHLMHFNWSTHNPWSPNEDYRPVNLNHGYYRIGNLLWHGIYWHGNHHLKTNMFNPGDMVSDKSLPVIAPGDTTEHYPPRKKIKRRPAAA